MTAVVLAPLVFQKFFATNNTGAPLVGGKLFTYVAGTSTKQVTYPDSTANTQNANPIILDAYGQADVWLDVTLKYKFVLAPSNDSDPPASPIKTVDNIDPSVQGLVDYKLIKYDTTDAETAASLTIVNAYYPVGNVLRYGTNTTPNTTDMTTAINAALKLAGETFVPNGDYLISSTLLMSLDYQVLRFESVNARIMPNADSFDCLTHGGSLQRVYNGTLYGQNVGTTSTSAGIRITASTRSNWYGVYVTRFGYGVRGQNPSVSNWVESFYGCYIFGNARAAYYGLGHGSSIYGGEMASSIFGVLQATLKAGTAVQIDRDSTSDLGDDINVYGGSMESLGSTATSKAITGAVTSAGLIKLTCTAHGRTTGDYVSITGVTGTTEANGVWPITIVDADHFTLQGSTFTNAYVSGGTMYWGAGGYSGVGGMGIRFHDVEIEDVPIFSVLGDSFKNDGTTAHSATVDTAVVENCLLSNGSIQSALVVMNRCNALTCVGNNWSGTSGTLINSRGANLAGSVFKTNNNGWTREYETTGSQVMQGATIYPVSKNGDIVWQMMVPATAGASTYTAAIQVANAGDSSFDVDLHKIRFASAVANGPLYLTSAAPANAGSTGSAGQITWDSGFLYICTAANTWKRVAIATW